MQSTLFEVGDIKTRCKAPFNNMYFSVLGRAGPCWLQVNVTSEWSESNSIKDIWHGPEFTKIRKDLANNEYCGKCTICKDNWDKDVWPLANAYDKFSTNSYPNYPTLLELELSNQCNLECEMCSGYLSSGIRKNRDKKPPLPAMYNDSFITQVVELLPHLEELRFNGGEPFAQKIVLDICDRAAEINPGLKINIATNGTVYNKRVEKILAQNNIHLNISIDSLDKDLYESIRVNADFNELMNNFKIFLDYCNTNKRELSVMVNPMRKNWHEMVDFLKFCDSNNVNLWYNTVKYPLSVALWNLDSEQLLKIYDTLTLELEDYRIVEPKVLKNKNNINITDHLIHNQIKTWLLDSYVA